MAKVRLESEQIVDWESFHLLCKKEFGFPEFYGMNMNSWIDCLSYINDEGDSMSRFNLKDNEKLEIEVSDTEDFKSSQPEIFDALIECVAVVNRRYKSPVLSLVFL